MRKLILVTAVFLMSSVGTAGAATISYISGDSVWLSSLDGSKKVKVSGPAGDGREWTESAQADNGRVIAVRREPGKVAPLNSFTLWGPDRKEIFQGSLNHESGWFTNAYPVGLDLTSDGKSMVYGYAVSRGLYPTMQFEFGTDVKLADGPAAIEPFRIVDRKWPTLVNDRIVAQDGDVVLQNASQQTPYGLDFTPWISLPGADIERTDVSATGTVIGLEATFGGVGKIALIKAQSLGGSLLPGDCFLPAQGNASEVTLSQDGKTLAWHDDRGVVASGIPDFSGAEPCVLTTPAVVIDPNGTFPSIGAAQLPTDGNNGGGGGDGGNGPGTGPGQAGAPTLIAPAKLKATSLKNGIVVKVKVRKAGKVTVAGKVNGKVVARGSAKAKKAGTVKVKLKAVGSVRNNLGSLKGKTITLKVTSNGKSSTVKRKLN